MTQPRWRETDPRPAHRDQPGPAIRPRTAAPGQALWTGEDPRRPAPPPARPRWGEFPARFGVSLLITSVAFGALVTVLGGAQPGVALSCFLLAGAAAAALAVRARSVYRLLPVPALVWLVSAMLAGLIHDRGTATSLTSLAIHAAQWIASGFIAMATATGLIVAIAAIRVSLDWRRRSSQLPPQTESADAVMRRTWPGSPRSTT